MVWKSLKYLILLICIMVAEVYLEPGQTSIMECFWENVTATAVNYFRKNAIS